MKTNKFDLNIEKLVLFKIGISLLNYKYWPNPLNNSSFIQTLINHSIYRYFFYSDWQTVKHYRRQINEN